MNKVVRFAGWWCLVASACAGDAAPSETELRSVMIERWAEYEAAYKAGDATRLGDFYTDSVWIRGPDPGWQSVRGRVAARQVLAEAFAAVTVHDISFVTEDLVPFGRFAFDSGTWSEAFSLPPSPDTLGIAGSYTVLWERASDGGWRISRLMWNVHAPEEVAAAEN